MKPNELIAYAGIAAGLIIAATVAIAFLTRPAQAADDPPLMLARDGFFYVNGKTTTVDGKDYVSHQMYVEVRIPAKQTHPYPIVMVHGGTMSGTNYTGTPDGREGWAQYFVRQGYAVYVVDQPGRARSGYLAEAYGPMHNVERGNALSRFVAQEKFKLWPQAELHTQWPGTRRAGRSGDASACREPAAGDRRFRHAAIPQSRCADGAARQDRAGDPARAFAGRRVRLAGGRCAARSGEGDPGDRAERSAVLSASNSSARPTGSSKARWRCLTASPRCR